MVRALERLLTPCEDASGAQKKKRLNKKGTDAAMLEESKEKASNV